jgi:hypothetical protein
VPLLDSIDLTGVAITADAPHTVRDHARYLTGRTRTTCPSSRRTSTVLHELLDGLPWDHTPTHTTLDTAHGQRERRTTQALPTPEHVGFPIAAQTFLVERYITNQNTAKISAVTVLGVTDPARLAGLVRGH